MILKDTWSSIGRIGPIQRHYCRRGALCCPGKLSTGKRITRAFGGYFIASGRWHGAVDGAVVEH